MKKNVGLWIDHAMAVIVIVTGEKGEDYEIKQFVSNIEDNLASDIVADSIRQNTRTEYLETYYNKIVSTFDGAKSILIFGPDEAKDELKTRLESNNLSGAKIIIESADKMTESQIVARVRGQFFEQCVAPDLK